MSWLAFTGVAHAQTCLAQSGPHTNALVERDTSEGCSRCPPADAWLSRFKHGSERTTGVVPMANPVDYWDGMELGCHGIRMPWNWDAMEWQNRYAQAECAKRQQALANSGRAQGVYTPQEVLHGHDSRHWHHTVSYEQDISAIQASPAKADIELDITHHHANA